MASWNQFQERTTCKIKLLVLFILIFKQGLSSSDSDDYDEDLQKLSQLEDHSGNVIMNLPEFGTNGLSFIKDTDLFDNKNKLG